MSEQRRPPKPGQGQWQEVAAGIRFAVALVAAGVTEPPRMVQWGGGADAPPNMVSIEYGQARVRVTSYSEPLWGDVPMTPFRNLRAAVENALGWMWAVRFERPDFAPDEAKANRLRFATEAPDRVVEMDVGGVSVPVTVVGDDDMWSAGFEAGRLEGPAGVLLSGESTPIESLKLELVEDLAARLGADG